MNILASTLLLAVTSVCFVKAAPSKSNCPPSNVWPEERFKMKCDEHGTRPVANCQDLHPICESLCSRSCSGGQQGYATFSTHSVRGPLLQETNSDATGGDILSAKVEGYFSSRGPGASGISRDRSTNVGMPQAAAKADRASNDGKHIITKRGFAAFSGAGEGADNIGTLPVVAAKTTDSNVEQPGTDNTDSAVSIEATDSTVGQPGTHGIDSAEADKATNSNNGQLDGDGIDSASFTPFSASGDQDNVGTLPVVAAETTDSNVEQPGTDNTDSAVAIEVTGSKVGQSDNTDGVDSAVSAKDTSSNIRQPGIDSADSALSIEATESTVGQPDTHGIDSAEADKATNSNNGQLDGNGIDSASFTPFADGNGSAGSGASGDGGKLGTLTVITSEDSNANDRGPGSVTSSGGDSNAEYSTSGNAGSEPTREKQGPVTGSDSTPQQLSMLAAFAEESLALVAALCPKSCGACGRSIDLDLVAAKWVSSSCVSRDSSISITQTGEASSLPKQQ